MKKQFIASLQEGDIVNDYFLAARRDLREMQNGGKFLGMVFKDRTGEIGGILWNNAASVAKLFEVGDVVSVRGRVCTYQGRLQIRADQVLPLRDDEYDSAELVAAASDTADILEAFRGIIETIQDEWLRKLTKLFLDDADFMARFATAAAGKRWHHAYRGGLLQHCYEIARLAMCVSEVFPQINRDILLAAVFLHDIGKLDEMSHDLLVEYTTAGKLVGHLNIGANMIQEQIKQIPGFPETLRLDLLHCVLSHHGALVNGSPVLPKTLEAIALYYCDDLDAQTDAFTRIISETQAKGDEWSDYINLVDRQVWARRRIE